MEALMDLQEVKKDRVCEDCTAVGEPCGYHAGFGDGWDAAVAVMKRDHDGEG